MKRYRITNKVSKNGRRLSVPVRKSAKLRRHYQAWCTVGTSKTKPYDLPFGTGVSSNDEGADKK